MKRLISDEELVAYISGQLNGEETREIYRKAIENGETDMLLHAQLAALACQEDLANELLGEDDFVYAENAGKVVLLNNNYAVAAKSPFHDPSKQKE